MSRLVTPFRSWHYQWLLEAGHAGEGQTAVLAPEVLALIEANNSWTCTVEGLPIACGGTILHWPGRHMAWAYLSRLTGPHMRWLTHVTQSKLGAVKGRIEATVREDFKAGQRWLHLLGFEIETPSMKRFGPQQETHIGFVRFN